MYNICYRMMNDKQEAEDMLQESFTNAFRKLNTFRYESNFGSWLKKIVIHKCINEIKRKKADLQYFEDMGHFDAMEDKPEIYREGLNIRNGKECFKWILNRIYVEVRKILVSIA